MWIHKLTRPLGALLALLLLACMANGPDAVQAQSDLLPSDLSRLSRAYLKSGNDAAREALLSYAARAEGPLRALAYLAAGMGSHNREEYEAAAKFLELAMKSPGGESLDGFGDYSAYYRARSLARTENHAGAAWVAVDFDKRFPKSRFIPQALQLRVECLIRSEHAADAKKMLLADPNPLPEPTRLYLLGRVQEIENSKGAAVDTYRRVYYYHPSSEQAKLSEERLNQLSRELGKAYTDALDTWRLKRADILYESGDYAEANRQYRLAVDGVSGVDKQRAQVRVGASDYQRLRTSIAYDWLKPLKISDPSLAAERLYYLGECERRKSLISSFEGRAEELKKSFPASPWYHEALFSLGNHYLLENNAAKSAGYYERAARDFPKGKYADLAHWKVCWRAWLGREARVGSLLEEHVRLYPDSPQASAAMYWYGRLLEKKGEKGVPAALYTEIAKQFPHYFYGYLARDRVAQLGKITPAPLPAWAANLPPARKTSSTRRPETEFVLTRGRLLFGLGLEDEAERELLTGDYRKSDGPLIGLEIANQLAERDLYFKGLRYMKRYGFGYLRMPFESMPREFWERLYPMPWGVELRDRAAPHQIDPYLVAGLIRQESEFNPVAVSRAGAMGLMQIMPRTGADLARRLGVPGFSTGHLHRPDVSLRLGTYHLKQVLARYDNRLEISLAAYNAGEHRADTWITWENFEEPLEFVETIPFTETRGYVQSVLRNASMYRALYGDSSERPKFAEMQTGE